MATSGSFTTNAYAGVRSLTFNWSLTSQSVEGNYSIINWSFVGSGSNNGYWYGCKNGYVNINGSREFTQSNYEAQLYYGTTLASGSTRIYHNNDGSKSFSADGGATIFNYGTYETGSGSWTLPTIPRASTVACSSPYIGDTATITIDKKSNSFTNTVTYSIGSLTGTIAEKTSDTVLSLDTSTLKNQIYALIPNAKRTTGTISCTTYNGNTQIGNTQSATFNLYAKEEDCKPIVSGTVIDTNSDTIALTGDSSIIVKNASKPRVTITATPNYSSTISSYSINLNDGQTSNLQEATFNTINSNSIIVDATDSRGYNNPTTIDLSNRTINYIKLHFNTIELNRPESTSNQVILNANGVWFNGDFSQSTSNTLSCSFQYKKSTDSSWTNGGTITPTINNNVFTFTNLSLGNSFDYNDEYQFKIIATDLLMTIGSDNKEAQTVPKGIAVVEIGDEFVNVNGTFTINDQALSIPSVLNTKSNSQTDTYCCNYINGLIEDFAQVHTSGVSAISTDGAVLTGWTTSTGLIESGQFKFDSTHHGIKIPAGSCNVIQPFGVICGSGYAWNKFQLYDANDNVVVDGHEYGILVQFGGNGYWCVSMPSTLMTIPDTTKDYYLKLRVSGYNGQNFIINNGYSTTATTMGVRKIK